MKLFTVFEELFVKPAVVHQFAGCALAFVYLLEHGKPVSICAAGPNCWRMPSWRKLKAASRPTGMVTLS